MEIRSAIAAACSALGLERLDAQLLLLHALGRQPGERAWLLAHDTDALNADAEMRYIHLTRQRAAGTPLAYLTGVREFFGLTLKVDPRVLDPRPDTETLVEWALVCLADIQTPHVVDLGTGSGAIALALKHARPDALLSAVDASREALDVAKANAQRLALEVSFTQGNWLDGIHQHAHLIVTNPPYIPEGDPHLEQLGHEPHLALSSGLDGLDAIRTIIAHAPAHLAPEGWLLLEHGWDQAQAVQSLLARAGFANVQSRKDLAGHERCSGGQWLAAPDPTP